MKEEGRGGEGGERRGRGGGEEGERRGRGGGEDRERTGRGGGEEGERRTNSLEGIGAFQDPWLHG